MRETKEWWGSDIVPRIRWMIPITDRWRMNIGEGDKIPNGYGVAWRQPGLDCTVIMPVPLNLIVRFFRELWWMIRVPQWGGRRERLEMRAYVRGRAYENIAAYERGVKVGYHNGYAARQAELESVLLDIRSDVQALKKEFGQ